MRPCLDGLVCHVDERTKRLIVGLVWPLLAHLTIATIGAVIARGDAANIESAFATAGPGMVLHLVATGRDISDRVRVCAKQHEAEKHLHDV